MCTYICVRTLNDRSIVSCTASDNRNIEIIVNVEKKENLNIYMQTHMFLYTLQKHRQMYALQTYMYVYEYPYIPCVSPIFKL